jgi:tight adherence protein C
MLLLLFGLCLLGFATALGVRAVTKASVQATDRLANIDAYGFAGGVRAEGPAIGSLRSGVDSIADRIGRAVGPRLSSFSEVEVTNRLLGAGIRDIPATTFLGYRILAGVLFPLVVLWLALTGGAPSGLVVFGAVFATVAGFMGPMLVLRDRVERRLGEIEAALPELIDLLVLMVEAGLGFSGSIRIASGQMRGPLGDELRLTLQEQTMGLSMNEALTNMLNRGETPSMRSFVRSILQGETLGVSIGAILRNLAIEMRKRRRQAAEERAQKAPIKMLFPLVFLIFPPIFIVLLYPALNSLTSSLGN